MTTNIQDQSDPASASAQLVKDYAALIRDLWGPGSGPTSGGGNGGGGGPVVAMGRRGGGLLGGSGGGSNGGFGSLSPSALKLQISKWAKQFSGCV